MHTQATKSVLARAARRDKPNALDRFATGKGSHIEEGTLFPENQLGRGIRPVALLFLYDRRVFGIADLVRRIVTIHP